MFILVSRKPVPLGAGFLVLLFSELGDGLHVTLSPKAPSKPVDNPLKTTTLDKESPAFAARVHEETSRWLRILGNQYYLRIGNSLIGASRICASSHPWSGSSVTVTRDPESLNYALY
jgi:hypothetical protein